METLELNFDKKLPVLSHNLKAMPFETLYRWQGYLLAEQSMLRSTTVGIVMFAVSSPLWFCAAVVLGIVGQTTMAMFFVMLTPACLLLALLFWLCLHYLIFPDSERKRLFLQRISVELRRRGQFPFTFAGDN